MRTLRMVLLVLVSWILVTVGIQMLHFLQKNSMFELGKFTNRMRDPGKYRDMDGQSKGKQDMSERHKEAVEIANSTAGDNDIKADRDMITRLKGERPKHQIMNTDLEREDRKTRINENEEGKMKIVSVDGFKATKQAPQISNHETDKLRCPEEPPSLVGRTTVQEDVTEAEAGKSVTNVKVGGSWSPLTCTPIWRVAIIVPYRDRPMMVGPFLKHMHQFLQRQLLNYTVYFVEQSVDQLFNRAKLLNIGYVLSRTDGPYDCWAFQDVDCVPENDHSLYYCSPHPRHLAVATSNKGYRLDYARRFGGACIMNDTQVRLVNGWSNSFYGWGGEDDEMRGRIDAEGMTVVRYPLRVAQYKMLAHKAEQRGMAARKGLHHRAKYRYKKDGLNTLNFTLIRTDKRPLYTRFLVQV